MKVKAKVQVTLVKEHEIEFETESLDEVDVRGEVYSEITDINWDEVRTTTYESNIGEITWLGSIDALIQEDIRQKTGAVIYVNGVHAFNAADDSDYYEMAPPLAVRVKADQEGKDTINDRGDWVDSNYDVDPVDPTDRRLAGLRTFWIDGLGISVNEDGKFEEGDVCYPLRTAEEVAELQERIREAQKLRRNGNK
jgi:hypothetical protein